MRLQYASDLHLEFAENMSFIEHGGIAPVCEVLVLAGDVSYLGDRKIWKRLNRNVKMLNVNFPSERVQAKLVWSLSSGRKVKEVKRGLVLRGIGPFLSACLPSALRIGIAKGAINRRTSERRGRAGSDYPEREGGKPKVNAAWDAIGEVIMANLAYSLVAYGLEGMDTLHYSRPFTGGALKVKRVTSSDDGNIEDNDGGDDTPGGGGDNGGSNGGGSSQSESGSNNGGNSGGNSGTVTPTVNAPNFSGAT